MAQMEAITYCFDYNSSLCAKPIYQDLHVFVEDSGKCKKEEAVYLSLLYRVSMGR